MSRRLTETDVRRIVQEAVDSALLRNGAALRRAAVPRRRVVVIREVTRLAGAGAADADADAGADSAVGADAGAADAGADSAPVAMPAASAAASHYTWSDEGRLALFPIVRDDLWGILKRIERAHWNADEVVLTEDRAHWDDDQKVGEPSREMLRHLFAYFSIADTLVGEVDSGLLATLDGCREARALYTAIVEQERIHDEAYQKQIEAVLSGSRFHEVVRLTQSSPAVVGLTAWVRAAKALPVPERWVALLAVEGVLFSSAFAVLQLYRTRGLLPGVTTFNSWILRDEGLHCEADALVIRKYLSARPTVERAHAIFAGAVDVVHAFVRGVVPEGLGILTPAALMKYVEFQADATLALAGYPAKWGTPNPLPFMEQQALNAGGKANFFERQVSQYQHQGGGGDDYDLGALLGAEAAAAMSTGAAAASAPAESENAALLRLARAGPTCNRKTGECTSCSA